MFVDFGFVQVDVELRVFLDYFVVFCLVFIDLFLNVIHQLLAHGVRFEFGGFVGLDRGARTVLRDGSGFVGVFHHFQLLKLILYLFVLQKLEQTKAILISSCQEMLALVKRNIIFQTKVHHI